MNGVLIACFILGLKMPWNFDFKSQVLLGSIIITQMVTGHPHMASSACLGIAVQFIAQAIVKSRIEKMADSYLIDKYTKKVIDMASQKTRREEIES